MATKSTLRRCKKGHQYYKSSDCPTCPVCEQEKQPTDGLLSILSAPTQRALENQHIKTEEDLSKFSEKEVLKFHGLGPGSIPKLKKVLQDKGLSFKVIDKASG